jgi:hypothetical protein
MRPECLANPPGEAAFGDRSAGARPASGRCADPDRVSGLIKGERMMRQRNVKKRLFVASVVTATVAGVGAWVSATPSAYATVTGTIVPLTVAESSSFGGGAGSADPVVDTTEIDQATVGDTDASDSGDFGSGVDQSLPTTVTGHGRSIGANKRAKSNPVLDTHFQGLNFHDQRFANGGNQFSVEPPDQALCAGNGFLLEAVNDILQVYNTSGTPLLNGGTAVDLNTFYGYSPAIVRSGPNAGQRGPTVTDPTCMFDQATNRFFLVVLTLDHVGLTANLNGKNHLDLAVSKSGDPTAGFTVFRLPVQNDGTDGTPNHGCTRVFCLGDYPHIGADANGVYLTTNEFSVFGSGFFGAQVYAVSKAALVAGTATSAVLFNTRGLTTDGAGFTVWPAQSPGTMFDGSNGGTQYFLSSNAVFSDHGTSSNIYQWSLSNTSSLNTATPALGLQFTSIPVLTYAVPPRATQKAGNRPLSDCLADTVIFPTCNTTVAGAASHNNATFGPPNGQLNSNDSRFGQVVYANGKLWGALGTAINMGGAADRAGVAYFVVNPGSHNLVLQGQAGLTSTDLTYPTVGVTDSGRGIISFTLTGDNDFPTAAYAPFDAHVGMGDVAIAQAGAGPWDGFTSYVQFGSGRPRWGDYGATTVMGDSIWAASEYVAQTCTYAQYLVVPRGQCGGTRGPLGNWSTHISQLTP